MAKSKKDKKPKVKDPRVFYGKHIFKYKGEINKYFRDALQAVQEETIGEMLDILTGENGIIYKSVYSKPPVAKENPFYERTEMLYNLFYASDVYYHGGEYAGIYGGIESDSNIFLQYVDSNPESQPNKGWQHSSQVKGEAPISAVDFINIVNNGVGASHSCFGERPDTMFWEKFIYTVDYKKIFLKKAQEMGISIRSGVGRGRLSQTISNDKKENWKTTIKNV